MSDVSPVSKVQEVLDRGAEGAHAHAPKAHGLGAGWKQQRQGTVVGDVRGSHARAGP